RARAVLLPQAASAPVYSVKNNGLDSVTAVSFSFLQCNSDPSRVAARYKFPFRFGQWSLGNYQGNFQVFAFSGSRLKPRRLEQVTDGTSSTVMVAEGMRL